MELVINELRIAKEPIKCDGWQFLFDYYFSLPNRLEWVNHHHLYVLVMAKQIIEPGWRIIYVELDDEGTKHTLNFFHKTYAYLDKIGILPDEVKPKT